MEFKAFIAFIVRLIPFYFCCIISRLVYFCTQITALCTRFYFFPVV